MVTLNDYKASCIKGRNIIMWHENTTNNNKNVLKEFFLFLVILWIQRLEEFGWNLLLEESADMKCAMYDQHVEY